jgi:hypothetical protein
MQPARPAAKVAWIRAPINAPRIEVIRKAASEVFGGRWSKGLRRTTTRAAVSHREEHYLMVAFTVMTDVPEALGP